MVFDANLVLRDGLVDLDSSESAAVILTTVNTDGAKCVDLGTTTRLRGDAEGVIHLTATLVLPSIPTTYAVYMDLKIQQSDNLSFGWEDLATFPRLYSYTRLLNVTVVNAFAAGDIGTVLLGGSTGDQAEIRWMHSDLLTIGNTANMIVTMQASDDVFDDVDEGVDATAGTGDGTMNGAAIVEARPRLGGPGSWTRAFGVTKRYLRPYTVVSGGNFGKGHILLSPYPFKTL